MQENSQHSTREHKPGNKAERISHAGPHSREPAMDSKNQNLKTAAAWAGKNSSSHKTPQTGSKWSKRPRRQQQPKQEKAGQTAATPSTHVRGKKVRTTPSGQKHEHEDSNNTKHSRRAEHTFSLNIQIQQCHLVIT